MQTALLLDQPDLIAPERTRRLRFGAEQGERIMILNARGRVFEGGGDEPELSLKWVPNGVADYASGRSHFRLAGAAQLLLNRGQPYRLRMAEESESFVMFFSRRLADRAWSAMTGGDLFPEVPSVAGLSHPQLQADLAVLRAEARGETPSAARLEETSFAILGGIARLAHKRRKMRDAVPAMRGATREELLRRLARAESYLVEEQNCATLEHAANVAALSPFHLIRMFRAVYGETPLAFANGRRLDSARDALMMTDDPIADIAERAGYDTRNAFDRAFARRFRTTPGKFRRN